MWYCSALGSSRSKAYLGAEVCVTDVMCKTLGSNWDSNFGRLQVVGDDILCTNPVRVKKGIEAKCVSALLLKVRQGGGLMHPSMELGHVRST